MGAIEKFFNFREKGTNFAQEFRGGLLTFLAMAYILAVNPNILSASGMPSESIFISTAIASGLACIGMGLYAKLPIALSSGMGLNAYFAFTVCGAMGYTWEVALAAVFTEGAIFLVLSMLGIREKIFEAIPTNLRKAVSVGIGLFIVLIAFFNIKLIVPDDGTTIAHWNFKGGQFNQFGITIIIALFGIFLVAALLAKNVKGAILISIVVTWGLGVLCQLIGLYVPDVETGAYSVIPSGIVSLSNIGAVKQTMFHLDFSPIMTPNFWFCVFAFLFVDIFDTIGTLTGCAMQGGLIDENGKVEHMREALTVDAVGTMLGSALGTSTITSFVESTSGIAEGAKTGFAAVVTGFLFLLSLIFSPLFLAIPSFATAPALVGVGMMMMRGSVSDICWKDFTEALPAFLCIIMMPFAYSIAMGIAYGFISYTAVNLIAKEYTIPDMVDDKGDLIKFSGWSKINPGLVVISILFVIKFAVFGS